MVAKGVDGPRQAAQRAGEAGKRQNGCAMTHRSSSYEELSRNRLTVMNRADVVGTHRGRAPSNVAIPARASPDGLGCRTRLGGAHRGGSRCWEEGIDGLARGGIAGGAELQEGAERLRERKGRERDDRWDP